jgi:hypothetical protein
MKRVDRRRGEEWVLRALDGDLSPAEREQLERALAEDAELSRFAAEQRRLAALLAGDSVADETPELEASAARAIAAAVRQRAAGAEPPATRELGGRRTLVLVGAAAAAAVLWWVLPRTDSGSPQGSSEPPGLPLAALAEDPDPRAPAALDTTGPSLAEELVATFGALADADEARRREAGERLASGDAGHRFRLRREVEALFDTDPAPEVARGALTYLGVCGDSLSLRVIEEFLADPQLGAVAATALADAGEAGWRSLAIATRNPATRELALAAWPASADGHSAAPLLEAAATAVLRGEELEPWRETLSRVAAAGGPALAAVLAGVGREPALEPLLLASLGPEHAPFLAEVGRGRTGEALICAAAAATGCDALVPELAAAARSGPTADAALASLAQLPGAAALAELVELYRGGRIPRERLQGLLAAGAPRDAEAWVGLADRLAARGGAQGEALAECLLELPEQDGARALVRLARAELPADLRFLAVAAADGSDRATADELRRLLGDLDRGDARLGARALQAHLTCTDLTATLALFPPSARDRFAPLLAPAAERGGAPDLLRLARELRSHLPLDFAGDLKP